MIKKAVQVVKETKSICSMSDLFQHNNRPSHCQSRRVSFTPSDAGCVDCDFYSSCTFGLQQSYDMLARTGSIDNTTLLQTIGSAPATDDATSSFESRDFNSSKNLEVQQFPRDISSFNHESPVDKQDNFDFDAELRNIFLVHQEAEESDDCTTLSLFPILEVSFHA